MPKFKDLTGMRFGRLTVVKRLENDKHNKSQWLCKCECGNETISRGGDLLRGHSTSCGCLTKERSKEALKEKWKHDDEFRAMHSSLMKQQRAEWEQDANYKQMQSERTKQQWQDEKFRELQNERLEKLWQDEEFRETHSGKGHYNYNPNLTDEDREDKRKKPEYKKWRDEVKKQANWTCNICGQHGYMEAHHLNDWHSNKEQRYDLTNGVCLCEKCHSDFHNYMGGTRVKCTEQDYEEFKKLKQESSDITC